MRLMLSTSLLSISLLLFPALAADSGTDWSHLVPSVHVATVPILCSLHQRVICTAFSIDRERGHYLTVSHCLHLGDDEDIPIIDKQELKIIFEDVDLDLAVIKITTQRPALKIQTKPLQIGVEVAALGFGLGRPVPSLRTAVVSRIDLTSNGLPFIGFDTALIGGMSGGPIVDYTGKIVGVATRSDPQTGYSLTPQFIYEHTKEFWAVQ